MKLITKCANMIGGSARVFRYTIINTAPIIEVIRTACRPRLQWARPKATEEIATIADELSVNLLRNVYM